jgi:hypothetical protein
MPTESARQLPQQERESDWCRSKNVKRGLSLVARAQRFHLFQEGVRQDSGMISILYCSLSRRRFNAARNEPVDTRKMSLNVVPNILADLPDS